MTAEQAAIQEPVRVFIALGCNLGERQQNLLRAVAEIEQLALVESVRCSSFYETDPMGPANQPDYINAVCETYTRFGAHELLDHLQAIEAAFGRVRTGERWGPRPLDLDIALYGQQIINTERLIVPHAGIAERSFVLWPLQELDPQLQVPGHGAVSDLAQKCPQYGIRRLQSTP